MFVKIGEAIEVDTDSLSIPNSISYIPTLNKSRQFISSVLRVYICGYYHCRKIISRISNAQ